MRIEELSVAGRIMYDRLKESNDFNNTEAVKRIIQAVYSGFPEHRECLREVIKNFFPGYLEIIDKIIMLS